MRFKSTMTVCTLVLLLVAWDLRSLIISDLIFYKKDIYNRAAATVLERYYNTSLALSAALDIAQCSSPACISNRLNQLDPHAFISVYQQQQNQNKIPMLVTQNSQQILKIPSFEETYQADILQIIEQMAQSTVNHVVVDLRGNGGGSYETALLTTSAFVKAGSSIAVPKGKSVLVSLSMRLWYPSKFTSKGISSILNRKWENYNIHKINVKNLTVIVDQHTASAAEQFAYLLTLSAQAVVRIQCEDQGSFGVLNSLRNNEVILPPLNGVGYSISVPMAYFPNYPRGLDQFCSKSETDQKSFTQAQTRETK